MTYVVNQGKEPYRLWFQFLKLALQSTEFKVKKAKYSEWGDIQSVGFDRWWREKGKVLIPLGANDVHVTTAAKCDTKHYHLVAIPRDISPTTARDQVLKLMKELASGNKGVARKWKLTEGKELKVASVRAYLHAYEAQQKLIKEALLKGDKASDVKAKHVLCEVRSYYNKKAARYKNNLFRVDSMPSRLIHGGNITDVALIKPDDCVDALKAINEYLTKARKILVNMANGEFPGNY